MGKCVIRVGHLVLGHVIEEWDGSNAFKILGRINSWKKIFCRLSNMIGGS